MSKPTAGSYRYVGGHVGDLDDGRILEPGQIIKLDAGQLEHPHNSRLLEEGLLLSTKPEKEGD